MMKKFIINTAILSPGINPKSCAANAPRMLAKAGVEDVKIISCYCCGSEGRAVFVAAADNRETVLSAFNKINVPVASIMETEEIKFKMQ